MPPDSAKDAHEGGIKPILEFVPDESACRMTIDCDGLDPSIMPAVSAPVPGALSQRKEIMTEKEEILNFLMETIGKEGCWVACEEAEIFKDQTGWKMFLEGFMEPWYIGNTVEEAKNSIKKYASMGFGLG